ncbi:low temperature requirement protein A [Halegenticoccus tardaugens]|uniref:low temperature requirement protein A n=1 Tax=Halegenticoccus tardaugens TaxID=2071624 RepID=UPI00100B9978|nr:low temperature requirement protein A [Halegenticoccus tardaugens]
MVGRWGRYLSSPALHDAEPVPERHATWLELFFDLVFVVAVAELGHLLGENLSLGGAVEFVALFVPVWWVWITHSYYGDIFDSGDAVYPLATLLVMFGVVVWATTFHGAFHGGSAAFAAAYLAIRTLNTALYAFAGRVASGTETLARRFALGYSVGLAFWVGSFFVPEPARYALWAVGLTIEILSSPIIYVTLPDVPAQESHMDERFGLFTIIVLGETIVGVARGSADVPLGPATGFTAVCGFVVAVCLWWLYFGYADASVINRALRSDARELALSFVYGYGHLIVFASLAAGGIGIERLLRAAAAGAALPVDERVVVSGAAAAFLLGLALIHWAAPGRIPRAILAARLLAGIGGLGLVVFGAGFTAAVLAGAFASLFVALVGFEASRTGRGVRVLEAEI